MSNWTSVSDRLPEEFKEVMAYEEFAGIFIENYSGDMWHVDKEFVTSFDGHVDDNITQSIVTHWQPLPNPPTDEQ